MVDWSSIEESELYRQVGSEASRERVLEVMGRLTQDPNWTPVITDLVRQGKIETRCFMAWLSKTLQPRHYLEIGVRRGFSMSMVASQTPGVSVYGFDLWVPRYAGSENPGPGFVAGELARVGYRGKASFVSGNSHQTVPAFFGERRSSWLQRWRVGRLAGRAPATFDLMLVDGDHSLLGAYDDLMATLPRIGVGGVMVFDDIAPSPDHVDAEAARREAGADPHGWGDLRGVWRAALARFPSFRSFEYTSNTPGVALAVRLA